MLLTAAGTRHALCPWHGTYRHNEVHCQAQQPGCPGSARLKHWTQRSRLAGTKGKSQLLLQCNSVARARGCKDLNALQSCTKTWAPPCATSARGNPGSIPAWVHSSITRWSLCQAKFQQWLISSVSQLPPTAVLHTLKHSAACLHPGVPLLKVWGNMIALHCDLSDMFMQKTKTFQNPRFSKGTAFTAWEPRLKRWEQKCSSHRSSPPCAASRGASLT